MTDFSMRGLYEIGLQIIIGPLHLWFLPAMLGAALLVVLLKNTSVKLMLLTILVTFFMGVVIQYLGNYHVIDNPKIDMWFNEFWVHRNFLFFAFPFFGLGFLINKLNVHKSLSFKATVALSFIGLLLLVTESYINFIEANREGGFDNFAALLLVCPAVFLLAIKLNIQGKSKELALYSTGIYFIHISIIYLYMQISDFSATASTFIIFGSSVVVSFFLIQLHKRLKFIL